MKIYRSPLAVALILTVSLFAAGTKGYTAAPLADAKILNAEGQVQAKIASGADWKTVQKGSELKAGSEIKTGPASTCEIGIGKSAVKLRPDSTAILTSLDPVKIDLRSGKILSMVRDLKPGVTFQVTTPTAVGAARGTGWEQSKDSVQVFEDKVQVTGSSGEANEIPEGKGVDIDSSGDLGEMFDVSQEAQKEWNEFKSDAEQNLGAGSSTEGGDSGNSQSGTGVSVEGDGQSSAAEEAFKDEEEGPAGEANNAIAESNEQKGTDQNLDDLLEDELDRDDHHTPPAQSGT